MLFLLILSLLILFSICGYENRSRHFCLDASVVLRGILVLLVVFHHLPQLDNTVAAFVQRMCGRYAVTLFFFMSGYGLFLQYENNKASFISSFFLKRYTKLLIPYILAWFLYIFCHTGYTAEMFIANAITGENVIPFAYFVEELAIFYLLFYLCFKYLSEFWAFILIFGMTLVMMSIFVIMGWNNHWWISSLGFPMGAIISKYRYYMCGFSWISTTICLILSAIYFIFRWCIAPDGIPLVFTFAFIASPLCCCLLSMCFSGLKWKSGILKYLGSISYEIYICQGAVLMFTPTAQTEVDCLFALSATAAAGIFFAT